MKNIKLTEEQSIEAMSILQEMLDPNSDITIQKTNPTTSEKNNPVTALNNLSKSARNQGIDPTKPGVHMSTTATINGKDMQLTGTNSNSSSTSTNESYVVTKKQLEEARLKRLKENSEIVKVKDFCK